MSALDFDVTSFPHPLALFNTAPSPPDACAAAGNQSDWDLPHSRDSELDDFAQDDGEGDVWELSRSSSSRLLNFSFSRLL